MNENPLGYEKIPKLLKGFAIPSIMPAYSVSSTPFWNPGCIARGTCR